MGGASIYFKKKLYHGSLIQDKLLNIYMVLGIPSFHGIIPAFMKYFPCNTRTIWNKHGVSFCRNIKEYTQYTVIGHTKIIRDPRFRTVIPYISPMDVKAVFDPFDRLLDIIRKPSDELEYGLVEAVDFLRDHINIRLNDIGVSGSMLMGIHSIQYSDIDIIIKGIHASEEVYSFLSETGFRRIVNWDNLNSRYILDKSMSSVIAEKRTRLYAMNKILSFIFIHSDIYSPKTCYDEQGSFNLADVNIRRYTIFKGPLRIRINRLGNALTYPPCVYTDKGILVSFDHIISPLLYGEECIRLEGVLKGLNYDGRNIFLLGVKETPLVKISRC